MAIAATATGCAPAISAGFHVDRNQDFAQYHSFEWGPADALPTGDARLDRNPFFKDHVQGAIERQLAVKGYELVSGPADLLVQYHANISQRIDVNATDRVHGYCPAEGCQTVMVYEAGTLVVDIIDARTGTLVWRGWAQNPVDNMLRDQGAMARTIELAVKQMLQRLPPVL
ncbi:MAG TPA: DUF4136 domain-containing protein [Vicinamibacterales bacterium]|nr:DUF4136 domain-containing protein [Vicinamibacterales bacterium]